LLKVNEMSDPRASLDVAAIGGGTLAIWGQIAGHLAPILSVIFLLLSIVWLAWRMIDRAIHGHQQKRDDD
jgi:hypothetical protein